MPENGLLTPYELGLYSIPKEVIDMPAPTVETPESRGRVDYSRMEDLPSPCGHATPFLKQFSFRPSELRIEADINGERPGEIALLVARERKAPDGQVETVGVPWIVNREDLEEGLNHLCFNSGRLICEDGTFLERTWTELNLATLKIEFERHERLK
jgi:hypothetical protein